MKFFSANRAQKDEGFMFGHKGKAVVIRARARRINVSKITQGLIFLTQGLGHTYLRSDITYLKYNSDARHQTFHRK